MPTAVVVATIVNTNMSEAGFREHVVEQLQANERSLLDKLADADGDANAVTAVLNVDEFLAYLIRRFPKAVDAAIATGEMDQAAVQEARRVVETATADPGIVDATTVDAGTVDTAKMSEGEFMNYLFEQLETGKIEPIVRFSDDDWDDDEEIGEDISRYPFFY